MVSSSRLSRSKAWSSSECVSGGQTRETDNKNLGQYFLLIKNIIEHLSCKNTFYIVWSGLGEITFDIRCLLPWLSVHQHVVLNSRLKVLQIQILFTTEQFQQKICSLAGHINCLQSSINFVSLYFYGCPFTTTKHLFFFTEECADFLLLINNLVYKMTEIVE